MKNSMRFGTILSKMADKSFKIPKISDDQFERIMPVPKKNLAKLFILTPRTNWKKNSKNKSKLSLK